VIYAFVSTKVKTAPSSENIVIVTSRFPIVASSGPVDTSALLRAVVGRRPKRDLRLPTRVRVVAAAGRRCSGGGIRCPTQHSHFSGPSRDHPSVTERVLRTHWSPPCAQRLYSHFCFVPAMEYISKHTDSFNCYALFKQMPSTYYSSIFVSSVFKYFLLKVFEMYLKCFLNGCPYYFVYNLSIVYKKGFSARPPNHYFSRTSRHRLFIFIFIFIII